MEIQKDFRELFELLNARGVEYVVVGAYALAFHGAPRYTGVMDIYVRPTQENAKRILAALGEFGFGDTGLSVADFSDPDRIAQLGYPPVRIDIITSLSGVSWDKVAEGIAQGDYGGIRVPYIGRKQLVANKKSTGRAKDLADLEALGGE